MASNFKIFIYVFVFTAFCVASVFCLDCYVCDSQDDNNGKCIKTVQQCGRDEDWCLSIIKWGSMPYWTQGAPKQYFISKLCATRDMCERTKRATLPQCDRIWYNDWTCSECCQGDRCNYYVTLDAPNLSANTFILIFGSVLACLNIWLRIFI